MNSEEILERIYSDTEPKGDAVDRPWLIAMSDWPSEREKDLLRLVEGLFAEASQDAPLPLVLIVDDVGSHEAAYRLRFEKLTEAGAVILEAQSEAELKMVRNDLTRFAVEILAVMQAPPLEYPRLPVEGYQEWLSKDAAALITTSTVGPNRSTPSQPQGYLEFGTAFTKLSEEQLIEILNIRR